MRGERMRAARRHGRQRRAPTAGPVRACALRGGTPRDRDFFSRRRRSPHRDRTIALEHAVVREHSRQQRFLGRCRQRQAQGQPHPTRVHSLYHPLPPMPEFPQILVRRGVDLKTFREEIIPAAKPVILADLVADWPVVRAARESSRAFVDLLRRYDRGTPVVVIDLPRETCGTLFYRDDLSGLNFTRNAGTISATLDRLLALSDVPDASTVFIESMPTDDFLPAFGVDHVNPLLEATTRPRIWIGNRIKVQTHYDLQYNIACCVAGRRRFTLFPPEQVANLYPGPIEFTPSGTPISMVPLTAPDLAKFPRYAEALRHAVQAELAPGDGIYIPYGWWHHVESLTPLNGLVNYWWNDAPKLGSPYGVL